MSTGTFTKKDIKKIQAMILRKSKINDFSIKLMVIPYMIIGVLAPTSILISALGFAGKIVITLLMFNIFAFFVFVGIGMFIAGIILFYLTKGY